MLMQSKPNTGLTIFPSRDALVQQRPQGGLLVRCRRRRLQRRPRRSLARRFLVGHRQQPLSSRFERATG
jgi:hypothetical protein